MFEFDERYLNYYYRWNRLLADYNNSRDEKIKEDVTKETKNHKDSVILEKTESDIKPD